MSQEMEYIKKLLENEHIRRKVSCYIQEEIIVPESSDDDQKIIFDKQPSRALKRKQKNKCRRKNSLTNVCGFNVNIQKLLENAEIRKVITPFIEKQILIPLWTNVSDGEETDQSDYNTPSPKSSSEEETEMDNEQRIYIKEEVDIDDSTPFILDNYESNKMVNNPCTEQNLLSVGRKRYSNNEIYNFPIIYAKPEITKDANCYLMSEKNMAYNNSAQENNKYKKIIKRNWLKNGGKLNINPKIKIRKFNLFGKSSRKNTKNIQLEMRNNTRLLNKSLNKIELENSTVNNDNTVNFIKNHNSDSYKDIKNNEFKNEEITIIKEEAVMPDDLNSINIFEDKNIGNKIAFTTLMDDNQLQAEVFESTYIKNEVIDLPLDCRDKKEVESSSNKNIQNYAVANENILNKEKTNCEVSVNQLPEQKLKSNINYNKNLQRVKRQRVHTRRLKYLKACLKCGKKYKRFIMLRNHEIKCQGKNEIFECALCSHKTNDKSAFKVHLENHILGSPNEITVEEDKPCQYEYETDEKTENRSSCTLKPCYLKCKINDDEIINNKCGECIANSDEIKNVSDRFLACQNKKLYVRLIRLEFTHPTISSLSPSTSSDCKPSSPEFLEKSDESTNVKQCSLLENDNSGIQSLSLISNTFPVESDNTKQFVFNGNDTNGDDNNFNNNNKDDHNDDRDCNDGNGSDNDHHKNRNGNDGINDINSQLPRPTRTSKSNELIQWFCQKCNLIQNRFKNFDVTWDNKTCRICKATLLYTCLNCEAKFTTYCTVAYHLRYCQVQSQEKIRTIFRKCNSMGKSVFKNKRMHKIENPKTVKRIGCTKTFNSVTNYVINKYECDIKTKCQKVKN